VTIKSSKNFWAGLMFISLGLFATLWSLNQYETGTALRMGPGYFPVVLGGLLALLGLVILGSSLAFSGAAVPRFRLRPIIFILGAVVAYGYLMAPLGLVLATLVLVVISALGGHEFRWREAFALGGVMIVISILVFVKGLTLPFPLCPRSIDDACVSALTAQQPKPPAEKRRTRK